MPRNTRTCNPANGECVDQVTADGVPCDDGDLCTNNDQCVAGLCSGTVVDCNAPPECHLPGTCNVMIGTCEYLDAAPDGTTCTQLGGQEGECMEGICVGTPDPGNCPDLTATDLPDCPCADAFHGVLCSDPAFPCNEANLVALDSADCWTEWLVLLAETGGTGGTGGLTYTLKSSFDGGVTWTYTCYTDETGEEVLDCGEYISCWLRLMAYEPSGGFVWGNLDWPEECDPVVPFLFPEGTRVAVKFNLITQTNVG